MSKKLPLIQNIIVEGIAADGKCFTKHEGIVIFIDGRTTAPQDVVNLQVTRKKKNFWEAKVIQILQPSPERVEPFCEHFGICGGCKWQHIPYKTQLNYKQQQVIDNLTKIGKVALPQESRAILAASPTEYYRNKLEFTFAHRRWFTSEEIQAQEITLIPEGLGFHIPGHFDKVISINHCHLQAEPSNAIRKLAGELALQSGLPFYNHHLHEGFWRSLVIRNSYKGEFMVLLIVGYENKEAIEHFLAALQERFPEISSLQYIINPKKNDTYHDLEVYLFAGEPFLLEKMENLQFQVGAKSFYQTNPEQALKLYQTAQEFAELTGKEIVYDLYTGTGTIAAFVAKKAEKVIGLEYVTQAIEDAKINAHLNNIPNIEFFAGDIKTLLTTDFLSKNGTPDVIITDPPRAGMHPEVVEMLLKIAPPVIVYVSCNPATQARDVALMAEKYQVTALQPVDMFPHTHHVENVLQLKLKQ